MSISSSEGSPLPVDLPTKYQKLAAEYAKVRSQVVVLKKGILDEQNRIFDMKEQLKLKDQMVRKHDQELDSLVFRNQQLTKRVTFLQEELELQKVENKKGQSKHENNSTEDMKLFQEELQNRILENAQLLSKLEEKEKEHENESKCLIEKAALLEKSLIVANSVTNRSCCCEDLQKKLSALESRYNNKHLVNGQNTDENIPFIGIQSLLKEVPLVDLITLIKKLAVCSCNFPLKKILDLLQDLEMELIAPDEKLDNTIQIISSIRSASAYYISMVQTDGSDSPNLLEMLVAIQEKCRIIDKSLTALKSQQNKSTKNMQENISQQPCKFCSSISEKYDKKIDELNARILKLTETAKEKLGRPENFLLSENESLESQNLEYEYGEASTNLEPEWSSDVVKEFVISKCSNALADVQLAESKLSRITSERDSAQSRLEDSLDVLQKRDSLVLRLEEELSDTSRSYKDQLNSMTEHMANLSDKLAAQQTKIEELTYELASCQDLKSRKHK